MAARMKPPRNDKTGNALRWASVAIALLGAADSVYLLVLKYTQAEVMCIGSHGCITVNNSPYSVIYGIPVSLFGILTYLALAAILLLEPRSKSAARHGPLAVFGLSLAGVLFSAYLTYIEYFVIFAVCPFCVGSAVLIALIFALAIVRLVRQPYS
ncbi:MAG: vitamin K epoxide reductase [Anaerolineaceae bacterium]|nr:MAG: vitamin K epoxide reductase [Anaerolineaceae bacterium]